MNSDKRQQLRGGEFRPTLIIGLGGTGTKVVMGVKYLFLKRYGRVPPIIRLLVVDTADERDRVNLELNSGDAVTLDANEFLSIEWVDTPRIMQRIHEPKFDNIRRWMPDKEEMPLYAVKAGAAQIRPLGRLAFFWHFDKKRIYDRLRGVFEGSPLSITNVERLDETHKLGFQITEGPGVDVFLVCSLCGGTGSGIFLDVAFLLQEMRGWQTYDTFAAFLAMPGVFGDTQAAKANAYAALKELDYMMGGGVYDYQYSDTVQVRSEGRQPFDFCYFIDLAQQEQERGVATIDDLAGVMAEGIFLQINNPTVGAERDAFANVQACLGRTLSNGRVTFYSSLGSSALYVQERELRIYCISRLSHELLRDFLPERLRPDDRSQAATLSADFIENQRLSEAKLLELMDQDAEGRPMRNRADLPERAFTQAPDNLLISRLSASRSNVRDSILPGSFRQMDSNLQTMATNLQAAITEVLVRTLDDRRPRVAVEFLRGLEDHLKVVRQEANENLGKRQREWELDRGETSPLQRAVAYQLDQLAQFLRGFVIIRKLSGDRKRRRLIAQCVGQINALHRAQLEVEERRRVNQLLALLLDHVNRERRRTEEFVVRLGNAAQRFSYQEEQSLPKEMGAVEVFRVPLLTAEDFSAKYTDQVPNLDAVRVAFFGASTPPVSTWLDKSQHEIAELLEAFARDRFSDLGRLNIEDIILEKQRTEGLVLPELLADLRRTSAPWIRYDQIELETPPENIEVLGVADANHSALFDAVAERSLYVISTRDDKQVILYRTTHGFSASSLMRIRDYRDNYNAVLRGAGKRPLHIDPQYQFVQEPVPGEDTGILLTLFSVGIGLGFITTRGSWVYLQRPERAVEDLRLGQGYPRAFENFRSNTDMVRLLQGVVDNKVKQLGYQQSGEKLQEYIDQRLNHPIGAYERMMLVRMEEYMRDELGVEPKLKF
ncbi:MAG: tubulin-like doman-containing protein [Anaerolineae bacterium]